jgi:hypothetical protein
MDLVRDAVALAINSIKMLAVLCDGDLVAGVGGMDGHRGNKV